MDYRLYMFITDFSVVWRYSRSWCCNQHLTKLGEGGGVLSPTPGFSRGFGNESFMEKRNNKGSRTIFIPDSIFLHNINCGPGVFSMALYLVTPYHQRTKEHFNS